MLRQLLLRDGISLGNIAIHAIVMATVVTTARNALPDAWPWDRDPEQHPFPPQSGSDETLKASTGCNASSVRSGSELLMRQGSTQHAHPRTQRLEATANINDKIAADA
jgi:hypothetical protein